MRYLRITGTPDLALAPEAFRVIADSEHVHEARLEAFNIGGEEVTLLYRIDGDLAATRESLAEAPEVTAVSDSWVGPGSGYLLVRFDPSQTVLGEHLFELFASSALVVLRPVVYREGTVRAQFVGEDAEIQTVMDHFPSSVDVEVHAITGTIPQPETAAEQLSERQREALRVALAVGYYDSPRRATHEDVADRLDCAPSTASEHLQKAEATLVRSTILEE